MSAGVPGTAIQEFKTDRVGALHGWIEAGGGARIYVRMQGDGPPLLGMGGIGSGAFTSAKITELLAARHRLISFDRRGTFRSATDQPRDFDIAQQCRDVLCILGVCGLASITVLSSCAATSIALELLARHPEVVNAMVVHDPMSVTALPDAEAATAKFMEYHRTSLEVSAADAMADFLADFELPYPDNFRQTMKREGRTVLWELMPCVTYRPDIEALRQYRDRLVIATGRQCLDRGYSFSRSARVLSEQIGCRFTVLPGNHAGYFQEPATFAEAVLGLIEELTA
jgi:pimeloyl-ACP methyl ester carboxylesterase